MNDSDYPSLPSESDPVLGRNGSPWGYAQLAADALAPSNLTSFYQDQIVPMFQGNSPGAKVKPPKGEILAPEDADMQEQIKPLKGTDFDRVVEVIGKYGVHPQDPKFLQYLGATAKQNGMLPSSSLGPLGLIRDKLFPDARKLIERQRALEHMGEVVFGELTKQKLDATQGPQTLGQAQGIAPGVIQPEQGQMIEAPRRGDMADAQGPMPGIADPNAALSMQQKQIVAPFTKSVAAGQLMPDSTGQLAPTSYVTATGKNLPGSVVEWMNAAVAAPLDQPLPQAPRDLPPAIMDTVIRERNKRLVNMDKGPDVTNVLDDLSFRDHQMDFKTLAKRDPQAAAQIHKLGEGVLRDRVQFKENEDLKRTIAAAYPVARAHAEAAQDSPVAEPQLWRDPVTGQAADARMTERQVRQAGRVKLRPDQVETFNQIATIDDGLTTIKEIAKDLFKPDANSVAGNILRVAGQRAYLAYLRTVGDERILLLDSVVSRMTAPMVKSQGDTANIAVAERDLFAKALVNSNASLEAILTNIDNISTQTRKARGLMGFKTREAFVQGLIDQGVKEEDILRILKEKGL